MRALLGFSRTRLSRSSQQVLRSFLIAVSLIAASVSAHAQITVSVSTIKYTVKQVVGTTSATKPVTVTNNGASAQTAVVSYSGDFTGNDCGGSIGGGATCTLNISFAPTIAGAISGAVTIQDGSGNLLAFVTLTGTGLAQVTTTPASLAFGSVPLGTTSVQKTFKIVNNTSGSVNVNNIAVSADYNLVSTGTCLTAALTHGQFCTVTISVTPTSATTNGAVVITTTAISVVVKLTATGTGTVGAPISLSKTALTFKAVNGGTSAAQTITVTNTSGASLTMGTLAASSNFSLATDNCSAKTLTATSPGNTCTFTVTFGPTFVGTVEGSVSVPYNTGSNSPQLVNLTGTGSDNLSASPTKETYASQGVGTTSTAKAVKITNNSASGITLNTISISGDYLIAATGTTCHNGTVLLALKSCTLEVQFAPTETGTIVGAVTIVPSSATPNPLLVALSGTAANTLSIAPNPTSAHQGSSETIVITGNNTHFSSSTTLNFGANITTGTITVDGPTSLSVPITVAASAAIGSRNISATTGAEVASGTFSIVAGVPQVTQINPSNIGTTASLAVNVTGAFTSWTGGTTKANFGAGVSVGGAAAGTFGPVTVNSGTSITANLTTSGAATGFRTVQIQTGPQTLTVPNGILVQNCTTNPPTVVLSSPVNDAQNQPLNTHYQFQFSVPMNRSTFTVFSSTNATGSVRFFDANTSKDIPFTISFDASSTIVTFTPTVTLPAGHELAVFLDWGSTIQDSCGNNLGAVENIFFTAFANDTTSPAETGTSPVNGDTNIPTNGNAAGGTPEVIQFSEPIDPITAEQGITVTSGGNPVAGNFTFSTDDKTVTFTPVSPLSASTTYTVTFTAQILDDVGNALTNPGSFSFTTGTTADTTSPQVISVDPVSGSTGVGLNVAPRVVFNDVMNQLTVTTPLGVFYENGSLVVPGTVTFTPDRKSATVTPNFPLLPGTFYGVFICGFATISGNGGGCFGSTFTTGTVGDTGHATFSINPPDTQTNVPVNVVITAVSSDDLDPTTFSNNAITVTKSGGGAVSGTSNLNADGVTLTFTPSAPLAVSTLYNVSVGAGLKDTEGNSVTVSNSSFTTGTTGFAGGSFTVSSTSPVNGATSVSVTSPVTFTMSNMVNTASVNPNTVFVFINNTGAVVAGTYSFPTASSVTFTPLSQYPANTLMDMEVCGIQDEAGNSACTFAGSFTTVNSPDTTAPTVTISPANGATGVGLNTQIVLTFSKSINPNTITAANVALFNGDQSIGFGASVSRDNRTVVLTFPGTSLPGATLTIALSNRVQDLSGNGLVPATSTFTMAQALSPNPPSVTVMRPGNGATDVPTNTPITLVTNMPMNASTIPSALHVTDNGVVISGSVQTFSNGQAIVFTPAGTYGAGDTVQATLDSTAQSASGVALSTFSGQFTTQGPPASTTSLVVTQNPFPNATNVPLNTIIQIEYDQPIQASSVTCNGNLGSVRLFEFATSTALTPNCSVSGGVITITPTANLLSGSQYQVFVNFGSNVTNTSGVAVQTDVFNFTAGTATDAVAPIITSLAPTDTSTNIGTNAVVSFNFNKAINPVSVSANTVQLLAGTTVQPISSMSFNSSFTRVTLTPIQPLPANTLMTLTINGVTSQAGKAVATKTTHFTTGGLDFTQPFVINSSVVSGQQNVPVNSAFSMQFNKPMDIGSFDPTETLLVDLNGAGVVATSVSWSADQTTVFLVPTSPLRVGDEYELESFNLTDLSGNLQQGFAIVFFAAFTPNTVPPTVVNTSPENTQTQVPINSIVDILFSEPIQPTSISQVSLKNGATAVPVTATFSNANKLLTLTPGAPLAQNTTYTLTITGVKDTAGNAMTSTVTNTFTTIGNFDVVAPFVTSWDPVPNSLGVGTNVDPKIVFNERINPLTINTNSVLLEENSTAVRVPFSVSMSADRMTATVTPNSALKANTQYFLDVGCSASYQDVAGNNGQCGVEVFTTASGGDTGHATFSINPPDTQTNVPVNVVITAVSSDDLDPTTFSNNAITVTKSGGGAVSGTSNLNADGVTLTFTPSAPLAVSTLYNVSVGAGLKDTEGNSVTVSNSSFTTGTTGFAGGSFTVSSTSPVNGATSVSVTSPVTFTMSNMVNTASVNPNTVFVFINNTGAVVAGTYSFPTASSVTFTPLSQYPANTLMDMEVCGIQDEAGNSACTFAGSFTTVNSPDTTAPTVTISPANGATNVGSNTQVILSFSESINPSTINSQSVNMLNGDAPINPGITISRDNRTLTLSPGQLPGGATITVTATHLVQDLSGNALADTTSQFTVAPPDSASAPSVLNMRPGNGATDVPTNTAITLFTSAPMNSGTLPGALHVSQNGIVVPGNSTVGSNGQSIEFTPTSALLQGKITQVFLDSTATDTFGNPLQAFSGQFTPQGPPASTTALPVTQNPFPNATNVPLNTIIQIEYDQPIQASSVTCNGNSGSVRLFEFATSTALTPNCSVSGNVITIQPTANLLSGSQYQVFVNFNSNVTNTSGVAVQTTAFNFTAGTATDTVAPTIKSIAPPDSSTNIGTNAGISVNFNKAINPVSVNGTSIQLSSISTGTIAPASISFTPDFTRVMITPQAPLPATTQMTITINGVTSEAGVAVASKTTHFTTMAGADFRTPNVVHASVDGSQTVGTNAAFAMQFSKPMDQGSYNANVFISDLTGGTTLTVTPSFSADLTTIMLTPTAALATGHEFEMCSSSMTDLSGNVQNGFCVVFFSGSGSDTTGPAVQRVSPPNGFTGVPTNAIVSVLFNEQIAGSSIGGVTLTQGANVIPTNATLYDGDQGIQLTPATPLTPGLTYTINVTGVKDITGNTQSAFTATSFTTGTGTDLVPPTVNSTTPTSGATLVPVTTTVKVVFSKAMDPASFDVNNSFTLRDPSNNVVPATITFSTDSKTATLNPKTNLNSATTYTMFVGNFFGVPVNDLDGNQTSDEFSFTTQ
jgi:large repetitive protein